MKEIITYSFGPYEFPSLDAAKEHAMVARPSITRWDSRSYDKCRWHGDSLIGIDHNENVVAEIRVLANHNFCNAPEGKCCEYLSETEN